MEKMNGENELDFQNSYVAKAKQIILSCSTYFLLTLAKMETFYILLFSLICVVLSVSLCLCSC